MLNRRELLNAINECESANDNFQNCQKLATLYILYDHLYADRAEPEVERIQMQIVQTDKDSDFMSAINGKQVESVLDLVDELMQTIKILHPRLYDSALRKANEIV